MTRRESRTAVNEQANRRGNVVRRCSRRTPATATALMTLPRDHEPPVRARYSLEEALELTLGIGAASPRDADQLDVVRREGSVTSEDRDAEHASLADEEPVEGVTMVLGLLVVGTPPTTGWPGEEAGPARGERERA